MGYGSLLINELVLAILPLKALLGKLFGQCIITCHVTKIQLTIYSQTVTQYCIISIQYKRNVDGKLFALAFIMDSGYLTDKMSVQSMACMMSI